MIELPHYGGEIAVFGLGRTGLAVVHALCAAGNDVVVWDEAPAQIEKAKAYGARARNLCTDMGTPKMLVLSPGVALSFPQPHNVVRAAHAASVPIMSDMDLFFDAMANLRKPPRIIAITGTNGKSTSTALCAHMFAKMGYETYYGGNIGIAVLELPMLKTQNGVYIVELSSYQIDLIQHFVPDIAVLTNISPDHLDRHGSMENYVKAKEKLFISHSTKPYAIIGIDGVYEAAMADRVDAACRVSAYGRQADIYYDGALLHIEATGETVSLKACESLRGTHNAQNAAAIMAVGLYCGFSTGDIINCFEDFPGLAHRMQHSARYGHIDFINDSKATNAQAAGHALSSFENIYWIVGGRAKTGGIASLAPYFPKIAKAYLIGEAARDFAWQIDGHMAYDISDTLEKAVYRAANDADAQKKPAVILLSPACASFDQFVDFEQRGDAFSAVAKQWCDMREAGERL